MDGELLCTFDVGKVGFSIGVYGSGDTRRLIKACVWMDSRFTVLQLVTRGASNRDLGFEQGRVFVLYTVQSIDFLAYNNVSSFIEDRYFRTRTFFFSCGQQA